MAKTQTYRVIWEIDLEATSHVTAAMLAREIQKDPESIATVFDVQRLDEETPTRVDLWDHRPGRKKKKVS